MKTVERENRNRWAAAMLSIRADGTAGQNRPCSSTWGWKQEKLQRWEKYFLLTSPSIERSREPLSRVPLGGGLENHRRQILAMGRGSLRDKGRTDGLHVISCWGKGAVSIPIYAYANRWYPLGPDLCRWLVRHVFCHEGDR